VADFFTDSDVSIALAPALRARGHGATTALAEGLRTASDAQQLLAAVQRGWILVTHNYRDFLLLHQAWNLWRQAGVVAYRLPRHPGMLVIPQQRWTDSEAAQEIDAFLRTNPAMEDMLYQWTVGRGWTARR
jgi:hypothetical protein